LRVTYDCDNYCNSKRAQRETLSLSIAGIESVWAEIPSVSTRGTAAYESEKYRPCTPPRSDDQSEFSILFMCWRDYRAYLDRRSLCHGNCVGRMFPVRCAGTALDIHGNQNIDGRSALACTSLSIRSLHCKKRQNPQIKHVEINAL